VRGRVRPHNRFFYFATWRGVRPKTTANRLWLLDPDAAAQFPNEDDLTVLVTGAHRSRLGEFRADLERAYMKMVAGLPDAPDVSDAERVSKVIGKLEMPNVIRPAARPGIAFVGDAALATDPLFGVGLTFAFQSAEWLVDETTTALRGGRDLDAALRRYRRRFAWRLGPHHLQIVDYATGRRTRPMERLSFRVATVDPVVALAIGEVVARERSPLHLFDPRITARLFLPRPTRSSTRQTPLGHSRPAPAPVSRVLHS
jgi:2-polyprenyl-6-methoxyphenol hydroxylase-like FAD-dependent oxidoreductase